MSGGEDDEARARLVHNEQVKLAATACNNIAAASVVTGVIVPLVMHVSAPSSAGGRYWAWFMIL